MQEADDWKQTVERLRATTEKDMWRADLDEFEQVGPVRVCAWCTSCVCKQEGLPCSAVLCALRAAACHPGRGQHLA